MAMKDFNSEFPESCRTNEVSTSWDTAIDKKIEDQTKDLNPNKDLDPTKDLIDYQAKNLMDADDDNVIKKRTKKRKNKEDKKHISKKNQIKLLSKRVKKLEDCLDSFMARLPKLQDLQTIYSVENAKYPSDKVDGDFEDLLKSFELKYGREALLQVNVGKTDDKRQKNVSENQIKKTERAKEYLFHNQKDYFLNEQKEIDMHHTSLHMHQINLSVIKRSETSMALNYPTNHKPVLVPRSKNFTARPGQSIPKGRVAVFVKLSEVEL